MVTITQKISRTCCYCLIKLIGFYQYVLSPWLGHHCRFLPTCSCYARSALQEYGVLQGLYLGLKRLLRCHPGNAGGYDPLLLRAKPYCPKVK